MILTEGEGEIARRTKFLAGGRAFFSLSFILPLVYMRISGLRIND